VLGLVSKVVSNVGREGTHVFSMSFPRGGPWHGGARSRFKRTTRSLPPVDGRQPGRHTESDVRARCRSRQDVSGRPCGRLSTDFKNNAVCFAFRWFRAEPTAEKAVRTKDFDVVTGPAASTSCCGPHSMHVCWNRGLILGELQMSFTLPYRTKWPRQIPGLCEGIALLSNVLVLHTACHRAIFPTLSLFCLTCIAVQAGGCVGRDSYFFPYFSRIEPTAKALLWRGEGLERMTAGEGTRKG
jgi:hypothetical protein